MIETELKKLTAAVTELTAALHTVRLPSVDGATAITPAPEPSTQGTTSDTAPAEASESAPVVVPDTTTPPVKTATEVVEAKVPTKKVLVEKFIELAQSKDREVAVKLLADFGVAKLPELTDKSKWAPFIARVDALLA